jgi:hypothetical protein
MTVLVHAVTRIRGLVPSRAHIVPTICPQLHISLVI